MRLDQTQIAIRERSFGALLDLSLHVTAHYARGLGASLLVLAVPLAVFNFWLVAGWRLDPQNPSDVADYFYFMGYLVFVEAPLGTLMITAYLGQAMFIPSPERAVVVEHWWRALPRSLPVLLGTRGCLLTWLLVWGAFHSNNGDRDAMAGFLMFLALFVATIRAARPYFPEIAILEQLRWRATSSQSVTLRRRNAFLQNGHTSELMSHWIAMVPVATILALSLYRSLELLASLFYVDTSAAWFLHLAYPLTLWLVAGYCAVVRFLAYIDLRIRREGWEVELLLRAAATRLSAERTPSAAPPLPPPPGRDTPDPALAIQ